MRPFKYLFLSVFLGFSISALGAEVKYLNDTIAKATPAEMSDLTKLLGQLSMVPEKDSKAGASVFRVRSVQKDSLWARNGIKAGDLVSMLAT